MRKIITFCLLAVLCNLFTPITFANDDDCYQLHNTSDTQACLGNAYSTDNGDARNIILNQCYSLSNWAQKSGLMQVCVQGKNGCYSLNDSDAVSACVSCNGSNKWARVYAVGYKMTCY